MNRLHSIEIETEHGICEIFLPEQEKKNIVEKCKSDCIKCNDRCELGYQAAELIII